MSGLPDKRDARPPAPTPPARGPRRRAHPGVVTVSGTDQQRRVAAECPLRPGHPCTLCHPEAHLGPQDCPTVAIVRDDPELQAEAARLRAAARRGPAAP